MAPRLLPASFRGVAFSVEAADHDLGRRTVKHEYPGRDEPFYEDLGRKAKEFRVTAFVVGDDFQERLRQLQDACDREGPGELVHPWYGTLRVQCVGAAVSYSSTEARMARLSLTFGEAGAQRYPTTEPDPAAGLDRAARQLKDLVAGEFAEGLVVDGVPEHVRAAAASEVERFAQDVLSRDVFGGAKNDVADLRRRVSRMILDAADLVLSPLELGAEVIRTVDGIVSAAVSRQRAIESLLELIARGPTAFDHPQAAANAAAFVTLVARAGLAAGGQAAGRAAYESRQQALDTRDAFADAIDIEAATASDEAFQGLQDLRTAICAAVPPPDQDLPELASVTLAACVPSLVLAYDLYEDAGREAEIVARNRIRHPGFVPAATPLEVLVDA